MLLDSILVRVGLVVVLIATVTDLKTRTIPNSLTLGSILVGLVVHGVGGFRESGFSGAAHGVLVTLGAIALCAAVPLLSFSRGEMGGGDVKLFAGVAALCGPRLGFDTQAFTFLVTLAIVLPFRLVRHGQLRIALSNIALFATNTFRARSDRLALQPLKLPPVVMAPSILAGFCLALSVHGALQ